MVELETNKWGVGVGGDREGAACAGGLDVPDVDVGEVGQALFGRDRRGELDPVVGDSLGVGAGGHRGVAVVRGPVHRHADGSADAIEGDVVDTDVGGVTAANAGGFEEDTAANAGLGGKVPGLDVVKSARGLAADSYCGGTAIDGGVVDLYVVGGAVDAEAVRVAAGLEAEGVVVAVDVGVGYFDVVG